MNSSTISNNKSLRCILTGFERNYPVKILSKQLNKLYFSTVSESNNILNPYLVSGFVSGDDNFDAGIRKKTIKWVIKYI
jgi:hypothetical protein